MVAYFLSVTDDKEKYNATLQMFFTINTVSVFLIHVFQGHVSGAMLPLVGAALAGTAVGTAVGMFLFRRLTMTGIKKVVYIFMMCAGSYLLYPESVCRDYRQTAHCMMIICLLILLKER